MSRTASAPAYTANPTTSRPCVRALAQIVKDYKFAPMRFLADAFLYTVQWDNAAEEGWFTK
jgi:hypothetical protein